MKAHVIKTRIITAMTYAMEVWHPPTLSERKGFNALEALVDDALHIAVLGVGAYNWRKKRCFKAAVLHHMLGVPTLRSEMAATHIRFANKVQAPAQNAGDAPHQAAADATQHEGVTLTQAIMKSLPSHHRWNVYTESEKKSSTRVLCRT